MQDDEGDKSFKNQRQQLGVSMKKISFLILGMMFIIAMAQAGDLYGEEAGAAETPDEVFAAYTETLYRDDLDGLMKYLAREIQPPPAELEKMKGMLEFIKGSKPREYSIVEQDINENEATLVVDGNTAMGPSRGKIFFIKEDGAWKIKNEEWASKTAQNIIDRRQARESGTVNQQYGSVSGTITMPQGVTAKGNLYLKLTAFADQTLLVGVTDSIVMEDSYLHSERVSYRFDELPLGEYFVVAVWDLAEPHCENNKPCPGFKGDYTGGSPVVEIKNPGEDVTADIRFMNFLQ